MASNSNFLFFLFFQANLEPKLTETMGLGNQLVVAEIVLVGLTSSLEMQLVLFLVFSVFYVIGILGNLLIVITVISDSHLHSPMYFLLANLSFFDMWISSIATPKMISDLFKERKVISFQGFIAHI